MEDCKAMPTPLNQKGKLRKDDGADKVDEVHYKSLVGGLMYLSATRLDIQYAINMLSRFMHCASSTHLTDTKRVLRYIKGTIEFSAKFRKTKNSSSKDSLIVSWEEQLMTSGAPLDTAS